MSENNETQEKQDTLVDLGDKVKGQIELPSIDITPYIGKKVKIAKVEEHKGNYGYYIKIITEPVDTIAKDKDNPIILKATKTLGLHEDSEGNLGWGEKTALGLYLKKKEVNHYKELVGKEVILQSQTSSKDEKDYLTFN